MKLLALDTCLDACSAALRTDAAVVAAITEPMRRGHQERLAPMVAELMDGAGWRFGDLDRIAVTVGPGSFTGLRVGLAFAKGLALALDKPCVGVGVLEALARGAGTKGFVAACLDAKRGQVYLQIFIDGRAAMAPDVLPVEIAAARLAELWPGGPAKLVGSGAPLLAPVLAETETLTPAAADPVAIAEIAAAAREPFPPPRPLYLRPPDAKLPGGIDPP
ncbi:tRNA (adenosine(37)-N6)-threonylcarbamoyltransferase complex dimerization subunit type 1 TsaB [Phenylobacterium montanum]|uniref:tRNA (Adenosine(37)-N6)-threonylcarbamoyltransferase complex dimerization subunit type 1 TsaB n=1 Tax=Phenylobacterium montanum TaxID=2823693 RepID=A0A975FW21_9CAUL|nr:tRNA (adenosine(37)-N6)-threonylcarbamoyltransferase complex dimerization subunit type 1 TsaB [Caulobacter sp. S6]QUD86435.1 tRNA (adenosine(37)-N6)-threonylcarbamoyltransferase complex dimerization subunit type 1 TsaB [Caulobacter sp. S6]